MIRRRKTETEAILGPLEGFLIRRTAELIAAIEAGTRTCCRENLDLLAAYERLDRLGRPLNAVASVAGAPRRSAAGLLSGQPVADKDMRASPGVWTGQVGGHIRDVEAVQIVAGRSSESGSGVRHGCGLAPRPRRTDLVAARREARPGAAALAAAPRWRLGRWWSGGMAVAASRRRR
jgi:hypothetical protein